MRNFSLIAGPSVRAKYQVCLSICFYIPSERIVEPKSCIEPKNLYPMNLNAKYELKLPIDRGVIARKGIYTNKGITLQF